MCILREPWHLCNAGDVAPHVGLRDRTPSAPRDTAQVRSILVDHALTAHQRLLQPRTVIDDGHGSSVVLVVAPLGINAAACPIQTSDVVLTRATTILLMTCKSKAVWLPNTGIVVQVITYPAVAAIYSIAEIRGYVQIRGPPDSARDRNDVCLVHFGKES